MSEHSPLGASGAERWLECPASFGLIERTGAEDTESEHASLGTAAHKLAEQCLESGKDAWEYVGTKVNGFDVAERDDAIDPNAVQVYLDFARPLAEGADFSAAEHPIGHKFKPNEYFWGTADFVALAGVLDVVDFKFGIGIGVDPAGNPQLKYYGFGVMMEVAPDLPDDFPVRLTIVQPRFASGEPVKSWFTTAGELRTWGNETLLPGMAKAAAGADDYQTGEHCRFCPAKIHCPKLREDFEMIANATVETTDEELDALYLKAGPAKIFIKAMEARLQARLVEGATLKNVKLVAKRTTRDWKEDTEPKLRMTFGDDAYNKALKSPAQIEKLSAKAKLFVAENAFLPPSTGYTLAAATDSAPAVNPAGDFEREFAHY